MTSTRLPGKVLLRLGGKTVLEHVVTRVRASRLVDEVVVAAPDHASSAPIAQECQRLGCAYVEGPEEDVLARYALAARHYQADTIVRVTSDCPLIDPTVVDYCILTFQAGQVASPVVDYASNALRRTFPRGLDTEVFSRAALEAAHERARDPLDREHVTRYIYTSGHFTLRHVELAEDLSRWRWTLDTIEDNEMFEAMFAEARKSHISSLTFEQTVRLMRASPWLGKINQHVEQKKS